MSQNPFSRYVVVAQAFGARTVLFQEAAGRRLGLSATQLECFQLVRLKGAMTAADLARETGLTQASLSVIIDKLVDQNFLSREQDRTDRRRWILTAPQDAAARVDAIYTAHVHRTTALIAEFGEEEFEAALRFMNRLAEELKMAAIELGQSNF
jgi:DNA-binding MarR family transcriptional regulator